MFLRCVGTARACEGTVGVVVCNVGGAARGDVEGEGEGGREGEVREVKEEQEEWTDDMWLGLSHVAMPFLASMGMLGAEEGMSVVEVDMQVLEDAEASYGMRKDLGRGEWRY